MSKTQWMVQAKKADFQAIGAAFGISPVTARLIRNRDVVGMDAVYQYLNGTVEDLYEPALLPDMARALEVLQRKIEEKKPVRIVGDYDIDGICSTYLLYQALKRVGAQVDYEIPDRIKDGYGINESIIRAAASDGVDTILTCDNGIAAIDQAELAAGLGMTMVVTDHHDIRQNEDGSDLLPRAAAVVNPKRQDSRYPHPEICGGMVAYKLVKGLYRIFGIPEEEWLDMMEFAALATVGDVMKLQDENRIVVKEGLKRIGRTRNLGLRKLIEKNNLDPDRITAYHIGFVIGPCLNASGRLETAKVALSLLLETDERKADELAGRLKELNDTRKDMTAKGVEDACAMVEEQYQEDWVLVVYLPDCHESLAGIVAGRLRERYHKPAIVLTPGEEAVKGSGRSIEGYHMFEALTEVSELLLKFGGHPMAAGLSLSGENVEALRRELNENARKKLTEQDFIEKIWIDVALPLEYVSEPLIQELSLLEPFGQGNEKPQFAQRHLRIRSARVAGKNRNVVMLSLVTESGFAMEARWFGDGDAFLEEMGAGRYMDVIYYPEINEYNGRRSLQIVVRQYRFSSDLS
ncbi:MAG: single-stranded-DNA-specific exonuclease RecJ [Lachnospiraceae bacterium]|nr:single-stranded-DNA-specific exonuclease RecJ [Lachnospiraceae bacterium]